MRVAVLAGDGIGLEVTRQAVKALQSVSKRHGMSIDLEQLPVGWCAIDEYGQALPPVTQETCRNVDAIYLGAVGLPDRDQTLPQEQRPERAALLALRAGNFANLRPIWCPQCMAEDGLRPVDILIVRELTGGLYTGTPRGRREANGVVEAYDTMRYSTAEIKRVADLAFEAARSRRKQVCSIDKANILSTSALWRETVEQLARTYPDVVLRHQLVDSAAPLLIGRPQEFDVVLTGNLFGDILSDLCGTLAGSLGMLPSACVGAEIGLFEPAHGSAPDIAGTDKANPIGAVLTMAMLLEFGLGRSTEAADVHSAVERVLQKGYRTADIMAAGRKLVGTEQLGDLIVGEIEGA